jgi:hypothetical protein
MPNISRVQRLGGGRIRYRGRIFPGFNKPTTAQKRVAALRKRLR